METPRIVWCESHLVDGERVAATTHSTNPDWSSLELCAECAAEYDSRPPVDDRRIERGDDDEDDGLPYDGIREHIRAADAEHANAPRVPGVEFDPNKVLDDLIAEATMERTIEYRGRTFTIRAIETEDGYTEAVAELGRDMSQPGYSSRESSEWDGSGIVYATAEACLDETDRLVRDTVDEDFADDSGS